MTKTPYELRFDALNLARDHLTSEYYADQDLVSKGGIPPSVIFPTPDQIFTLAKRIKSFIDEKEPIEIVTARLDHVSMPSTIEEFNHITRTLDNTIPMDADKTVIKVVEPENNINTEYANDR